MPLLDIAQQPRQRGFAVEEGPIAQILVIVLGRMHRGLRFAQPPAGVAPRSDSLPTTLAAARAAITAQDEALAAAEKRAEAAEARAAAAENEAKSNALLIEKLKFTIAKLRHAQFGQSAERGAILEQLELQFANFEEECVASAGASRGRRGRGRRCHQNQRRSLPTQAAGTAAVAG
jgi:hypothetical protein